MGTVKPWASTHGPKQPSRKSSRSLRARGTYAALCPTGESTVLIHGDTCDAMFEDGHQSPALDIRSFCKDQGFGIVNYGYDGEHVAYQFRDIETANRFRFAFPYPTKYKKPE